MNQLDKHLHIITREKPRPENFENTEMLSAILAYLQCKGVWVHLHYFCHSPEGDEVPNEGCCSQHHYPPKNGHQAFSPSLPYAVTSGMNEKLLQRLLEDDHPILIEGIAASFLLSDKRFARRRILLLLHRVEFDYYRTLVKSTTSLLQKIFLYHESKKLRQYETGLAQYGLIVSDSESVIDVYKDKLGAKNIHRINLPSPWQQVNAQPGTGCFCLFHANLDKMERETAVMWLLKQVFFKLKWPVVIACNQPSSRLENMVHRKSNCCLVSDPGAGELADMVRKAHVNIFYSPFPDSCRWPAIHALYEGRHCVIPQGTYIPPSLKPAFHMAGSSKDYIRIVEELFETPFTGDEISRREALLDTAFASPAHSNEWMKAIFG